MQKDSDLEILLALLWAHSIHVPLGSGRYAPIGARQLARLAGLTEYQARMLLAQLAGVGAIEWRSRGGHKLLQPPASPSAIVNLPLELERAQSTGAEMNSVAELGRWWAAVARKGAG